MIDFKGYVDGGSSRVEKQKTIPWKLAQNPLSPVLKSS
jgi:hypothetical protein